ncbi:MAG: NYN domain-containing protein [Syntrophobacterales bacterium]|jgi:predicted RNA-binding protein with PIN domain|nr:NYN domain-containing protein [Syntrophobacterales bacterium]
MHIVIDGYNFIRQSISLCSFDRRSLEEGRKALLRFLIPYKKSRRHNITVVFDAWDSDNPFEERDLWRGIEIIYSRRGREADDVIKELIDNKTGKEILVVTSDRDVSHYANRRNAAVMSSQEFEQTIFKILSTGQEQATSHEKENDEEDEHQSLKGGAKKGPSRKLSRRKRHSHNSIKKL